MPDSAGEQDNPSKTISSRESISSLKKTAFHTAYIPEYIISTPPYPRISSSRNPTYSLLPQSQLPSSISLVPYSFTIFLNPRSRLVRNHSSLNGSLKSIIDPNQGHPNQNNRLVKEKSAPVDSWEGFLGPELWQIAYASAQLCTRGFRR